MLVLGMLHPAFLNRAVHDLWHPGAAPAYWVAHQGAYLSHSTPGEGHLGSLGWLHGVPAVRFSLQSRAPGKPTLWEGAFPGCKRLVHRQHGLPDAQASPPQSCSWHASSQVTLLGLSNSTSTIPELDCEGSSYATRSSWPSTASLP